MGEFIVRLRDAFANRLLARSGLDFVNRVVTRSGRAAVSLSSYDNWLADLRADERLRTTFETKAAATLKRLAPHKITGRWDDRLASIPHIIDAYYILVRAVRPDYVVETGVSIGTTTALILAAMDHSGHGQLTSIDTPVASGGMEGTFDASEIGIMVPSEFRSRWDLRLADAKVELPLALAARPPEMFCHDSDHSYAHMMFEYREAFRHMAPGSIVVSDDTNMNRAFGDFYSSLRRWPTKHKANPAIGVVAL